MELTIVGAGAIGGTLGAYMCRAGLPVRLVDADPDHIETTRRNGLTIRAFDETFTVRVTALSPDELSGDLDVVLLAVKAQHTTEALCALEPHLTEKTAVVSLQNGLCERTIADVLGPDRTVGSLVGFSADYLEPGVIDYRGPGTVRIGELDGAGSDRIVELRRRLEAWGPVEVTDNIWGYLWAKMGYANVLFASALTDEPIADFIDERRPLAAQLAAEVYEVADREGVRPESFEDIEPTAYYPRDELDAVRLDASLDRLVARRRRDTKTHSGIWRDLAVRGRRTEVDEQIGRVAQIGRSHGLDMTLTERVVAMIHEIEDGSRLHDVANLAQLVAVLPVVASR